MTDQPPTPPAPPPPPPPPPEGSFPPPPPPGYQQPGQLPNAPGAVPALVMGIISIVLCSFLGPFAIWQGRKAEALANSGNYGGGGMAKAGWIMGIVGTVFLALGVLFVALGVIAL